MNRLDNAKRAHVVRALVEGNSIRATVRMTGIAKNTIVKLLIELGAACSRYQDETIRNVRSRRLQCDEIWSFIGAKQKNATDEQKSFGWGDCWTWTALDADTKLIVSFRLGDRAVATAYDFMSDLAGRLVNRVQLTTDSHRAYLNAVDGTFGVEIDYALLAKIYKTVRVKLAATARRGASGAKRKSCQASRTRSASAHRTWSVKTSRCGCQCDGSRG